MPLTLIHKVLVNGSKMLHFEQVRPHRFARGGCELTLRRWGISPLMVEKLALGSAVMGCAKVGGKHGSAARRSDRGFLPQSPITGSTAFSLPADACNRERKF